MKTKYFFPLLTILALCFFIFLDQCLASTFSYFDGSFFSQSDAVTTNGTETDNPPVLADWGTSSASSQVDASVTGASASGWGHGGVTIDNNNLSLNVEGHASGTSFVSTGTGNSYGNANDPDGIFFIIEPTGDENMGDPVIINYSWSAEIDTGNAGRADVTGGFGNHPFIMRNNSEVWHHDDIFIDDANAYYVGNESGSFTALIGDIIGLNTGAGASITYSGIGDYSSDAWSHIELTAEAVPIPGAVWLFGSAVLGLVGVRRKRQ
jgi:hypothetical protein